MKIADERDVAAGIEQALFDFGDGGGGFGDIYGDADEFRAGLGEFQALLGGGGDVNRVGVGHGLDDHRGAAADLDFADFYAYGFVTLLCHVFTIVANGWRGLLGVVGGGVMEFKGSTMNADEHW